MQKRLLSLVSLLLWLTTTMMAQVTTSSMSGKVVLQGTNEEIIGATVQAVHEPSGTRYATVTNTNGRFNIQGMRVGGPYTVTVSYVGHQTKVFKGIKLQLGEIYNLEVWLSEDAQQLGEVIISAQASKFAAEKTGATTNISQRQIESMPTVSRSITDLTRLSPYSNGMSFAGGDGRSTNFTLDGANMNNNFGLSSKLPGGGSPISMDAIDEIQVVVSPFDVRQSNFIGGGINAVTKSGTNTFRGTAYIYHNNENMHGNRVDDMTLPDPGKVRNTTYGMTFGGPIIKNKLFFFVNGEYSKIPTVVNRWRASTNGVAKPDEFISRTKISDMKKVQDFMATQYGYNTGSYTSFPADESNYKLLARLDWNITQDHHLAIRFNHTKNTNWLNPNGNSGNTGFRLNGMDRLSEYSMSFANSMYSVDNKITTISADLNSRFGEHFANQLLFTYSNIADVRGTKSSVFPFIDIMNGYSASATSSVAGAFNFGTAAAPSYITQTLEPYMSLGYELFTYNNEVVNKVTTLTDNFTWYAGAHKVTAGINFEHQTAFNSYMRNGTGYYRYRSLDDFLTGAAPEAVALTYGYNGETNPAAQVAFNQIGLYLQDEWNATNNFKLTGGIRFDNISFNNNDVMRNNAIYNLDFGGRKIDTGAWPKTNIQISPRVGFVWDVFGDKSLKVRGGTGLFAGRLPLVFFTNMPTNSGMVQNIATAVTRYKNGVVTYSDPRLAQFAGGIVTNTSDIIAKLGAPTTITPAQGTLPSSIAGVDHNFKMPQVWKSSIAVDYVIPTSFPWTVSSEFIYTKKLNDVLLTNYNINTSDISTWSRLNGADNRLIYPSQFNYYSIKFNNINVNDACVLTNTHKGHGMTFNIMTTLTPVENLDLMASYTHTVMKEVSGMPGSNALSAWQGLFTVNGPNLSTVQNSQYVIPDRLIASITYTWKKHDHFSLFYQGYSPYGYSYYYQGDINGDGIQYDLMYIPRDDSEINFTNNADRDAFWNYVNQDKYLKNHKGEYAEAFTARAPWVHTFDFSWKHDFTLKAGNTNHKLQASLDIQNVGNLFNSRWGVAQNMANSGNGQILKVDKVQNGTPYFSMRKLNGAYPTKTWSYNRVYSQCWRMQIGLKYFFN